MIGQFKRAKVIPVLVFERADDALPVAGALISGGLSVLEVTLRTTESWAALDAIVANHPEASVGVGTVLEPGQMARAAAAGAKFAVSPGFDPELSAAARSCGLFHLPGAATASEVMLARRAGHRFLKFFPAEAAGGMPVLSSFASPFGDISFCPTGGVGPGNVAAYLALDNVACVGGSWLATADDMARRDWQGIAAKARAAVLALT